MDIYEPLRPHAEPSEDGFCNRHRDRSATGLLPVESVNRLWCITGGSPVIADVIRPEASRTFADGQWSLPPSREFRLEPGTRLRLDAALGGRFYEGGEHQSDTWRLCVLNGDLAGTCWRADRVVFADGTVLSWDPVRPITRLLEIE